MSTLHTTVTLHSSVANREEAPKNKLHKILQLWHVTFLRLITILLRAIKASEVTSFFLLQMLYVQRKVKCTRCVVLHASVPVVKFRWILPVWRNVSRVVTAQKAQPSEMTINVYLITSVLATTMDANTKQELYLNLQSVANG